MKYNAAIKDKEDLFKLICSDFQDVFLSEKRIYRVCYLFCKRGKIIYKYLSICRKDDQKKILTF